MDQAGAISTATSKIIVAEERETHQGSENRPASAPARQYIEPSQGAQQEQFLNSIAEKERIHNTQVGPDKVFPGPQTGAPLL